MLLHQLVNIDSQVSSVKAAYADMDNSLLDGAIALVGWVLDLRLTCHRNVQQVLAVELEGYHCDQTN